METERLLLRRFTEADVDDLVELDSDPAVMRFLTGGRATPRQVVAEELLPRLIRGRGRDGLGAWAAVEKSTGDFLGWFALTPVAGRGADVVELGYRLRASAWGKGYATEGSRALIRRGFTELGVQRIVAETMAVNAASRRVMEKVGMSLVRTFHETWADPIAGTEHGEVEYAVDYVDWRRREHDR